MNRSLYFTLARTNVKKNRNTFLPFALSAGSMIAIFYMLLTINSQISQEVFKGARTMRVVLYFGLWVTGIFAVAVIFYTNSFLIKRRKRELGLYSILGLEKKHIALVVLWEIVIIGALSIAGGLFFGIIFSKLMFLLLLNILKLSTSIAFSISIEAIIFTLVVCLAVFLAVIIYNNLRIFWLKPIELMSGGSQGEREPKAKLFIALLGLIALGIGYYLALTTENPITAMATFFVAVLFVIAGTYMLFISGSIAFLKLLKKNKGYFYHRKHFITISGMIYRMKQNAVGLANICILSTAVLVVLSTTVSVYVGLEKALKNIYPSDVITNYVYDQEEDRRKESDKSYDPELIDKTIKKEIEKYSLSIKNIRNYYSLEVDGYFTGGNFTKSWDYTKIINLNVITVKDYNKLTGNNEALENNQVLMYSSFPYEFNKVSFGAISFDDIKSIKKPGLLGQDNMFFDSVLVVVPSFENLNAIEDYINENNLDGGFNSICYNYNFDLAGEDKNIEEFNLNLRDALNAAKIARVADVTSVYTTRQEYLEAYGSLFFIGLFLGTVFIIATVLIIYYKQISEGFDDRNRFKIMQQVGMSKQEVKGTIKNQILTVFFLPLVMAIVHISFAFNIISKILRIFSLSDIALLIKCTGAVILVFAIIYALVYVITARTYYKIINE